MRKYTTLFSNLVPRRTANDRNLWSVRSRLWRDLILFSCAKTSSMSSVVRAVIVRHLVLAVFLRGSRSTQ